jgi:hypothetical protein
MSTLKLSPQAKAKRAKQPLSIRQQLKAVKAEQAQATSKHKSKPKQGSAPTRQQPPRPLSLLGLCFEGGEWRLVLQFQGDDNLSSTWCSVLKLYDQSSGDMAVVIKALVLRWRALQKDIPADTGWSNDVRQKENKERE